MTDGAAENCGADCYYNRRTPGLTTRNFTAGS